MKRRDFLIATSGLVIGSAGIKELLAGRQSKPILSGWIPNPQSIRQFKRNNRQPMFQQAGKDLAGTGEGKKAFLWKYFEQVTGKRVIPHFQGLGDCTAHTWALGIDFLDCIQISKGRGRWIAKTASEIIYAGGRIEVGDGIIKGDGMFSTHAAEWCRDYGVLLRKPYLSGKYDFTIYDPEKARKWAHKCNKCTSWGGGVPDELEPLCKQHPVKTTTLVTSWEQARDAVYNGYPVALSSRVGFNEERDIDGFAKEDGKWYHTILMCGVDDSIRRPGGLLINSWGEEWIEGPTRYDQPAGSFWVDAKVLDRMLKEKDSESFAMSNYIGYPRQHLDYHMY